MNRNTILWNHIYWNRSMATKRSSIRLAADLALANVAMPPRRHLLQWVKGLVAMEEVVEPEDVVVVRDKRCPPEEEAEVVRATLRSVQMHAAHEEPGAPRAVASMSRTPAYAPGVAHLPSALANH